MTPYYIFGSLLAQISQSLSLLLLSFTLSNSLLGIYRTLLAFILTVGPLCTFGIDQYLLKCRTKFNSFDDVSALYSNVLPIIIAFSLALSFVYVNSFSNVNADSVLSLTTAISLTFCTISYSFSSILASFYQRSGSHKSFIIVFSAERIFPSCVVILFALTLPAFSSICAFAIGYIAYILFLFVVFRADVYIHAFPGSLLNISFSYIRSLISNVKGATLLTLLAVLPSNLEYFLLPAINVSYSEIGSYAQASLFFTGSVALLAPIIKKITSLSTTNEIIGYIVVNQKKLFLLGVVVAFFSAIASIILSYFWPSHFTFRFLSYSFAFALKTVSWSAICLSGAVLYIINKTRLSLFLAISQLVAPALLLIISHSPLVFIYSQTFLYVISLFLIHRFALRKVSA